MICSQYVCRRNTTIENNTFEKGPMCLDLIHSLSDKEFNGTVSNRTCHSVVNALLLQMLLDLY